MKSHQSKYALLATLLLAGHVSASTFFDDFNRPDSSTVGNGWLNATATTSGDVGTFQIQNNEATFITTANASAAIYRPADFSGSFTIDATLKETNGFGGLTNRYDQYITIFNDGTIGHGYGLNIGRSDSISNNSYITLLDGTNALSTILSPFQFGSAIDTHVTFSPDGSVVGSISQGTSQFDFSFGSHTIQSSGTNFLYSAVSPDNSSVNSLFPRIDNITLTSIPTPEPSSTLLVVSGVVLCLRRRTLRTNDRNG